ncbi:MAG: TlpA family protein disulfide reductase [Candidatus Hydrogenedentes bacterium]|nr:TlpA family protein disulfide reductase [Candidatus Hydrogenedentota bacterium]
MRISVFVTAVVALLACVAPAYAAGLGDPAKPLAIAEWVKGAPVDIAAGNGKNIYLIEFWATYCPSCVKLIPHLTELQKKYKDKGLIVAGIANEDPEMIKLFVQEQGAQMEYSVGIDLNRQTNDRFMGEFGYEVIPIAFVIDKKGAIVWHGPPFDPEMDTVIAKLVDGTFDLKELQRQQQLAKEKQAHYARYFDLAGAGEDKKAADEEAEWIMKNGADDVMLMRTVAMNILFAGSLKYRDKNLAARAAQRAYELTEGSDPRTLLTYAKTLFDAGKLDEAIKHQKRAIELNKDERLAPLLKAALTAYESAKTGVGPVQSN